MKSQEIKKLIEKYSQEQLEVCIMHQLEKGKNECEVIDDTDKVIKELSKAVVIKDMMDSGMKFSDALRELGRRIRAVYGTEGDGKKE